MAAATASTIAPNMPDSNDVADSMGEADTVYQELTSFLSSPRADLRKAAAEATLAALSSEGSASNEAARRLTSLNAILPLCRIASASSSEAGSNDALAALSMLCSHDLVGGQCILDFIETGKGIGRMLEIALSSPPTPPSTAASIAAMKDSESSDDGNNSNTAKLAAEWDEWRRRVNYACALLANACRDERGAVEFIGLSFPDEAIPTSMVKDRGEEKDDGEFGSYGKRDARPTAALLLSRFLNPAYIDTTSPGYKSALEAWEKPNPEGSTKRKEASMFEEYDPDTDDNIDLDGEEDESPASEEPLEAKKELPTTVDENEHYDPYQHVASVIMNVTQLETGRDFLMKLIHATKKGAGLGSVKEDEKKSDAPATSHLQSLLPQLESPNASRRRGIAGTLKNCCFSQDSIWWLLNVVNVDKSLLMTLAGPEELTIDEKVGLDPDYWLLGPQKVREPDALVRLYVVEALLLLLASGRRARETLRERRMYVIVKLADMVEESEEVSERLLECVQYLRRDEEGTEDGSSDRRAYEKYARGMMEVDGAKNLRALPMSTTATESAAVVKSGGGDDAEDYDNID